MSYAASKMEVLSATPSEAVILIEGSSLTYRVIKGKIKCMSRTGPYIGSYLSRCAYDLAVLEMLNTRRDAKGVHVLRRRFEDFF